MRKLILFFILVGAGAAVRAQTSYNYGKYGIGFFASSNFPYADLKTANKGKTYNITGYYNLTPYVPLGLEFQFGGLSGGSIVTDESRRQYDNHYKAFIFHGDFALGQIIDYDRDPFMKVIKDFYMGTGVGIINNNMAFIQRTNLNGSPNLPPGTYTFPGQNSSTNLVIPIRFGYEFKIYNGYDEPFMGINIGYIHNVTLGEGLDGYSDPGTGFKNNSPDQYRQIIVGVKINFGQSVPYTKAIN
ncbi:hypothetical protein [Mucilaginibacter sp. UR6-11]|uniref:hypothetical protein n=1 Tax=Mucilaginibacter sp. UR6-11 TaxID=1435644 RepID=UPI001E49A649|nr:hypothetical protein [Mucilaginibacter sp. UR6-11]MCC8424660.1 hypothetical protein [Mucilaginibacter sp. UR6-11]